MDSGREFHDDGPALLKARLLNEHNYIADK